MRNSRGLTSLRTEHRVVTRYENALAGHRAPHDRRHRRPAASQGLRGGFRRPLRISPPTGWAICCSRSTGRISILWRLSTRASDSTVLLARIFCIPMSRAVFGKRIRELHSTEFGFSGRLATIA